MVDFFVINQTQTQTQTQTSKIRDFEKSSENSECSENSDS